LPQIHSNLWIDLVEGALGSLYAGFFFFLLIKDKEEDELGPCLSIRFTNNLTSIPLHYLLRNVEAKTDTLSVQLL